VLTVKSTFFAAFFIAISETQSKAETKFSKKKNRSCNENERRKKKSFDGVDDAKKENN
jgi:hypothetical protein